MSQLGQHLIIELIDCPFELINSVETVEKLMNQTADIMGATIVESRFHNFSPIGVSGVVIIKESHLTIHTWPEHGYAAVDIFTCGKIDLKAGGVFLEKALKAKSIKKKMIGRGIELGIPIRDV